MRAGRCLHKILSKSIYAQACNWAAFASVSSRARSKKIINGWGIQPIRARDPLLACRSAFSRIAIFSGVINVVVIVAHRSGALEGVDRIAIRREGRIVTMEPREQVLRIIMRQPALRIAAPGTALAAAPARQATA